ncbi:hypothetical protein [Rhizobium sp. MHM7A]|uniref:hypothetical protein n=1 Tax=Rhizobium sp. MHM7A TaxID=2583233 RepID=UPI0011061558|nr:hypothetical protein [Rhizobium sp. MHM7A]TLX16687.1 hypothetical protein FFR93_04920 [Rhizobium sp. MHM7A]
MTQIVVTQAAVRKLAAILSNTNTTSMRHGDRLDLIASAFGWKTDAFMHSLKKTGKALTPAVVDAIEPSPFDDQPWGRGVPLRKLGIRLCFAWELAAEQNSGVLIATGATGSGRSTTLTSTALFLAKQGRKLQPGNDELLLQYGKPGDVISFGYISTRERAYLAYQLAEKGMLVLASMGHSAFDDLSLLRNLGISAKRLELTRAIIHQKLVRKIAPKLADGVAGPKYQGRTLVSDVQVFDKQRSVEQFLSGPNYGERHFLADLVEKLDGKVIDREEIESQFGNDVFKMFGRRLP